MTFNLGQRAVVIDASAAMALLAGEESWLDRWRGWTDAGSRVNDSNESCQQASNPAYWPT